MSKINSLQLPPIDAETDYLYDTVNWLKITRNDAAKRVNARKILAQTLREQSEVCRKQAKLYNGVDLSIYYGDSAPDGQGMEAFDWFSPVHMSPKMQHVIVYIHGGFWQALDLPECSHWATAVTEAGCIFVALAYRLAPWQRIKTIPQRLCDGLYTVFTHSQQRIREITGSTPHIRMHLVGHSAGAQLAIESVVEATKLTVLKRQWLDSVESLVLLSGVYDLRPLIHTSLNKALQIDSSEQAWQLSPLRLCTDLEQANRIPDCIRWLVAWAEYDSPALIEQSCRLVEWLKDWKRSDDRETDRTNLKKLDTFYMRDEDHFTSIEKLHLGSKTSSFFTKMVEFIGI